MSHLPDRPGRRRRPRPAHRAPRSRGLRRHAGTAAALGGVLVAGVAVSGWSSFDAPPRPADSTSTGHNAGDRAHDDAGDGAGDVAREREVAALTQTSRHAIRTQIDQLRPTDERAQSELGGGGVSSAAELPPTDPREIALSLLPRYGWDASQFGCLDELWVGESNWEVDATNPSSGAYGIPQALPAEKMAAFGADWRTNPATQIRWGLWYIEQSYGSPCSANEFKHANNWY
ncbi:MAG TPA: lytic transglycosylase domain-containing protein [Nocardioidaceae bacterium]|nr:lytic transglycosylase domain-containing protein [Nocardioidaceae bacterium]